MRWGDLVSSLPYLISANSDGHVYTETGESDAGSALDGYRVEPILSLGETQRALLLEIWFGLSAIGNYKLYVYYRGADTAAACESQPWTSIDEVSVNSPSNAVCYTAQNNRFHQIKWGTDSASEPFSVNAITFRYAEQGDY
jgi:hypothetical protein